MAVPRNADHSEHVFGVSVQCSCGFATPGFFGEDAKEQAIARWKVHQSYQVRTDEPRLREVVWAEIVRGTHDEVQARKDALRLEIPREVGVIRTNLDFFSYYPFNGEDSYVVLEVQGGHNPLHAEYWAKHAHILNTGKRKGKGK